MNLKLTVLVRPTLEVALQLLPSLSPACYRIDNYCQSHPPIPIEDCGNDFSCYLRAPCKGAGAEFVTVFMNQRAKAIMEERPRQRLSFDRQGEIDCTISIGEGFPDAQLFKFVLQSLPVQPHGERRLAYISAVTIQDPQEVIPLKSRSGRFVRHLLQSRGG